MANPGGTPYVAGGPRPQGAPGVRTPGGRPQPQVNRRVAAAGKALGAHGTRPAPKAPAKQPAAKPAGQPKSPYIGGQIIDPLGNLTRAQKQNLAGGIKEAEGARNQGIMETYGAKNKETANAEGTTANRLTGINQGTQTALGGLLQGAEGSAKTFDNQMAENSLGATKAVETAGQNALTSSGGYLDPQVRAELQAGTNYVAGIGAAATARATELGQAGTNAIRQQAAAALTRGQENQNEARNRFFGERLKNTNAENTELGRSAAKAKEERMTIPKELETQLLAKQVAEHKGLIEEGKLAATNRGINIKAGTLANQERSTNNRRLGELEKNAIGRRNAQTNVEKLGVTERGQTLTAQYHSESLAQKERSNESTARYHEAQIAAKERATTAKERGTGKPIPAGAQAKYYKEAGRALTAFERAGFEAGAQKRKAPNYAQVRQELAEGYEIHKVGGKPKGVKVESVTNPWIVKAMEEVWRFHNVGAATKRGLESIGLKGTGWSELLYRRGK